MNNGQITSLTAIGTIDRAADLLEIVDFSANASHSVTVNNLLGITGGVVLSTVDTQNVENKTFDATNVFTVLDSNLTLTHAGGKSAKFSVSAVSGSAIFTLPAATDTLVGLAAVQTLINKTITEAILNLPTIDDFTLAQHDHSSPSEGGEIAGGGGGGGGSILLQTGGVTNGSQVKLNLVAGDNMTLTDDDSGNITLAAAGGGGSNVIVATITTTSGEVGSASNIIPYDNTLPDASADEGEGVFTITYTGTSADNFLSLDAEVMVSPHAATQTVIGYIYVYDPDNDTSETVAVDALTMTIDSIGKLKLHADIIASTDNLEYIVNVGPATTDTVTIGGVNGVGKFSNAPAKSSMTLTEYVPAS